MPMNDYCDCVSIGLVSKIRKLTNMHSKSEISRSYDINIMFNRFLSIISNALTIEKKAMLSASGMLGRLKNKQKKNR